MNCTTCGEIEKYSGYDNSKIEYVCGSCVQAMLQPVDKEWVRRMIEKNVSRGLQLITGKGKTNGIKRHERDTDRGRVVRHSRY